MQHGWDVVDKDMDMYMLGPNRALATGMMDMSRGATA